jgi:hypothetical protein
MSKTRYWILVAMVGGGLMLMLFTSRNGYLTLPGVVGFFMAMAGIAISFAPR